MEINRLIYFKFITIFYPLPLLQVKKENSLLRKREDKDTEKINKLLGIEKELKSQIKKIKSGSTVSFDDVLSPIII